MLLYPEHHCYSENWCSTIEIHESFQGRRLYAMKLWDIPLERRLLIQSSFILLEMFTKDLFNLSMQKIGLQSSKMLPPHTHRAHKKANLEKYKHDDFQLSLWDTPLIILIHKSFKNALSMQQLNITYTSATYLLSRGLEQQRIQKTFNRLIRNFPILNRHQ